MNSLAEGYRYDIQKATQMNEAINKAKQTVQSALDGRNIKTEKILEADEKGRIKLDENGREIAHGNVKGKTMADLFLEASPEARTEILKVADYANSLGEDVSFGDFSFSSLSFAITISVEL